MSLLGTRCLFGLDIVMVAVGGWWLARALAPRAAGLLEPLVAWLLCVIGTVVASGLVIGAAGWFNVAGFSAAHLVLLAGLALWRARQRAECGSGWKTWLDEWRHTGRNDPVRWAALVLLGVWLGLGVLAATSHPVVYDALAYRLPRIAYWLHDLRITYLLAEDPRMDYMPFAPDVVSGWLLTSGNEGFRPAALMQWLGGGLFLGATAGLARVSGLGRAAALGAAALTLGMANVVPQFTSFHTDLFTAGIFTAAFYLWLRDLARDKPSLLGGLGAGLALGAKGTVLYLGPAAAVWLAACAFQWPASVRAWRGTILAGMLGIVLFAAPTYWLNLHYYGNPVGPAEHVAQHHAGAFADKVGINAWTALIQCFEPHSQPWPLRDAAAQAGLRLAETVPNTTDLTWENYNRREMLQGIMRRETPDADMTTPGLLTVLLLGLGVALAIGRRREPSARLVLVWAGGLLASFLFFHGMQRWHAFGYRYLILMAPWVAVIGAWGLQALPPAGAKAGWTLALAGALSVFWHINTETFQAGWRATVAPGRAAGYAVAQQWGDWAAGLDPAKGEVTVSLAVNRPVAGFFRRPDLPSVRLVRLPTAPALNAEGFARAQGGWVIVPAAFFVGREGGVVGSTWLDHGNEAGVYSLAAYRLLAPGEVAPPIVYRSLGEQRGAVYRHTLLVRPANGEVTVAVRNPGDTEMKFMILTAAGRSAASVAAQQELHLRVALPADLVSEVAFDFPSGKILPEVTVPAAR